MKTLVLIDGNSLMNRAYHAFKSNGKRNAEGVPMNMVWGFGKFLKGIQNRYNPTHGFIAFDGDGYSFRKLLYPDYKDHRGSKDEDFKRQKPYVQELSKLMGYSILQDDMLEADDLIGSLLYQVHESFDRIHIISSDHDLLQLLKFQNVVMEFPKKGFSEVLTVSRHDCETEFGYTPDNVVDFKALAGDTSDNIKGVEGIGEKTALELLSTYKNVEEIYANIDDLKPAIREKLLSGVGGYQISKTLATLVTTAFVTNKPETLLLKPDNESKKRFLVENDMI